MFCAARHFSQQGWQGQGAAHMPAGYGYDAQYQQYQQYAAAPAPQMQGGFVAEGGPPGGGRGRGYSAGR